MIDKILPKIVVTVEVATADSHFILPGMTIVFITTMVVRSMVLGKADLAIILLPLWR